ncbi:transcription antitermination factor NusB [Neisseria sp. Ec49-e6-T10]|uniref:transcription antitermination factor NusB n=1 Tax=Neisseria sp. Ec49-e6-T10 TaxID=3140744 RepID=UPI003EBC9024
MKTPRRRAREFVVQGLYQWQLNPELSATTIEKNLQENEYFAKANLELFRAIFFGVLKDKDVYATQVLPLLDRAVEEVNPVERAILWMACFELMNMPETPYPVIINEAIETTKTYGGTDGYKFVNGILDKLALSLRPDEVRMKENE